MDEDISRARLIVRGRVNGVHYPSTTVSVAVRLALAGWVREDPLGSVEILVEGPAEDVDEFIDWARHDGPPAAVIESVDVTYEDAAGDLPAFSHLE